MQNLSQNHMSDLAEVRSLVKQGNYEAMNILYDDIPDTLSQLIRTAFVPRKGMKFIVSDFSAIEARVLSHLAGENGEQMFLLVAEIFTVHQQARCSRYRLKSTVKMPI